MKPGAEASGSGFRRNFKTSFFHFFNFFFDFFRGYPPLLSALYLKISIATIILMVFSTCWSNVDLTVFRRSE